MAASRARATPPPSPAGGSHAGLTRGAGRRHRSSSAPQLPFPFSLTSRTLSLSSSRTLLPPNSCPFRCSWYQALFPPSPALSPPPSPPLPARLTSSVCAAAMAAFVPVAGLSRPWAWRQAGTAPGRPCPLPRVCAWTPRHGRVVVPAGSPRAAPPPGDGGVPVTPPSMTAATTAVVPSTSAPEMESFAAFFAVQPGKWQSRRTYHYLGDDTTESSETTFDVASLPDDAVRRVLAVNDVAGGGPPPAGATGFTVSFLTRMTAGLVRNSTNLVFVPIAVDAATKTVTGKYYRDMGYEEEGAVGADFEFRPAEGGGGELLMTTWYTRVVSVDSILLVGGADAGWTRVRKILNYARGDRAKGAGVRGLPVGLAGFGIEVRGAEDLVVEK